MSRHKETIFFNGRELSVEEIRLLKQFRIFPTQEQVTPEDPGKLLGDAKSTIRELYEEYCS